MFGPLLTRTEDHDLPRTGLIIAGSSLAAALTACGGGGEGQVSRAAVDEAVKEALASQAATAPDDAPAAQQRPQTLTRLRHDIPSVGQKLAADARGHAQEMVFAGLAPAEAVRRLERDPGWQVPADLLPKVEDLVAA